LLAVVVLAVTDRPKRLVRVRVAVEADRVFPVVAAVLREGSDSLAEMRPVAASVAVLAVAAAVLFLARPDGI
jgi:hypothetical protein